LGANTWRRGVDDTKDIIVSDNLFRQLQIAFVCDIIARYMRYMRSNATFALIVICSVASRAQTIEDLEHKLTGAQSRVWTFERFDITLGKGKSCKSGESYQFSSDHKVTIERCEHNQVMDDVRPWSVEKKSELDTYITIGKDRYLLLFHDQGREHFLRLRTLPSGPGKIVDKELLLTKG
jgi:hypothetical protein